MPIFVEKLSHDEVESRWALASTAQKAELKRSLRDPKVWLEQVVSLLGAAIKAFCLVSVMELVFRDAGIPPVTLPITVLLALPIVAWNPWQMFWRIVFLDNASAAFQAVIDDLDAQR